MHRVPKEDWPKLQKDQKCSTSTYNSFALCGKFAVFTWYRLYPISSSQFSSTSQSLEEQIIHVGDWTKVVSPVLIRKKLFTRRCSSGFWRRVESGLQGWRWTQHIPPNSWHLPMGLHGAKTQKNIIIILTAVKTSNLTHVYMEQITCRFMQMVSSVYDRLHRRLVSNLLCVVWRRGFYRPSPPRWPGRVPWCLAETLWVGCPCWQ
jgi:hypothetical protein